MINEISPLQVLVVEDNLTNQKVICAMLKKKGHTPVIANNGKKGVELYQNQEFDLVLMDIQMPEMNGFDATKAIREIEQQTGKHVPIIAVTAHAMKGYREECLEAGMNNYIAKPVSFQGLFEIINETLNAAAADR